MKSDDREVLSAVIIIIAVVLFVLSFGVNMYLIKNKEVLELKCKTYSESYNAVIEAYKNENKE